MQNPCKKFISQKKNHKAFVYKGILTKLYQSEQSEILVILGVLNFLIIIIHFLFFRIQKNLIIGEKFSQWMFHKICNFVQFSWRYSGLFNSGLPA